MHSQTPKDVYLCIQPHRTGGTVGDFCTLSFIYYHVPPRVNNNSTRKRRASSRILHPLPLSLSATRAQVAMSMPPLRQSREEKWVAERKQKCIGEEETYRPRTPLQLQLTSLAGTTRPNIRPATA